MAEKPSRPRCWSWRRREPSSTACLLFHSFTGCSASRHCLRWYRLLLAPDFRLLQAERQPGVPRLPEQRELRLELLELRELLGQQEFRLVRLEVSAREWQREELEKVLPLRQ